MAWTAPTTTSCAAYAPARNDAPPADYGLQGHAQVDRPMFCVVKRHRRIGTHARHVNRLAESRIHGGRTHRRGGRRDAASGFVHKVEAASCCRGIHRSVRCWQLLALLHEARGVESGWCAPRHKRDGECHVIRVRNEAIRRLCAAVPLPRRPLKLSRLKMAEAKSALSTADAGYMSPDTTLLPSRPRFLRIVCCAFLSSVSTSVQQ